MEQLTRKFAIEQAIKLVSTQNIEKKTKAVFDFADEIVKYIGEPTKVEQKPLGWTFFDEWEKSQQTK